MDPGTATVRALGLPLLAERHDMEPIMKTPHYIALGTRFLGALLLTASAFSNLDAQDAPPQERKGVWYQVGLGGGSLECSGCAAIRGSSGTLAIGGTINSRLLIGGLGNVWLSNPEGLTMTTFSVIARFYPSSTGGFFLQAGLGSASLELTEKSDSNSITGGSAVFGIGYDFRVRKQFSITPFFNGVMGSFQGGDANQNQLGVALTWH